MLCEYICYLFCESFVSVPCADDDADDDDSVGERQVFVVAC